MTGKQFIRKYTPCKDAVKWGLSTGCKTMREIWERDDPCPVYRVGKKAAGCLLDGKEWKQFPEVSK